MKMLRICESSLMKISNLRIELKKKNHIRKSGIEWCNNDFSPKEILIVFFLETKRKCFYGSQMKNKKNKIISNLVYR